MPGRGWVGGVLMVVTVTVPACGHRATAAIAPTAVPTTTLAPKEPPDAALRRQLLELSRAQYGLAWDELVPDQQAIVTRDRFIECQTRHSAVGTTVSVDRIVTTYVETVQIPGTTDTLTSTALTVDLSVGDGAAKKKATTTVHEFPIAGRWRWNLDPVPADDYRAGVCPP